MGDETTTKQRAVGHFNLLVDALREAAYEFCQPCMEYNDLFLEPDELVRKGCYKPDGVCFVQRWLNLLHDISNGGTSKVRPNQIHIKSKDLDEIKSEISNAWNVLNQFQARTPHPLSRGVLTIAMNSLEHALKSIEEMEGKSK